MPLPKGDVHKKKEVIQDVTLHDLDVANARPQVKKERKKDVKGKGGKERKREREKKRNCR